MPDLSYSYLSLCNELAARLGQNRVTILQLSPTLWRCGSAPDLPDKYGVDVPLDYEVTAETPEAAFLALSILLQDECERLGV